jgi:DNA-directed RNA polymerase subunit RPC12/RpoP
MTHFQCGHCGARLRVPDTHAGQEGRCPRCQERVTVPPMPAREAQTPRPAVERGNSGDSKAHPRVPVFDAAFPDVLRQGGVSDEAPSRSHGSHGPAQDLQEPAEQAVTEAIEPASGSRLPWLIDVFLYPLNLAGVIHLVSLWLLVSLLCPSVMQYLGLGTEYAPFVYTLPVAYVVYYLAECIRGSAGGARRAPDFWMSPGDSSKWDCLSQFVQVVGCVAVCFWPVAVYYIVRERADGIYWLLLACGGFFLPMILLAVVWFDSYSGLNPLLIVGSMLRTLVPYSAIVLLLAGGALLFVKMGLKTYGFRRPPPLPFVLRLVQLYLMFVAAGLLGRFYQRYKERLRWDA